MTREDEQIVDRGFFLVVWIVGALFLVPRAADGPVDKLVVALVLWGAVPVLGEALVWDQPRSGA